MRMVSAIDPVRVTFVFCPEKVYFFVCNKMDGA
jgi:hypothetical protein